ncbi:MAG: hypothetical protein GVY19_10905 [Bacteroidetes bacterium]|jgi:hypothetical protein|nr:hypothetical protein [Bacteroidota bacterium]
MTFKRLLTLLVIALLLIKCGDRTPDVENITVNTTINRFDKDIFNVTLDKLNEEIDQLIQQYPDFLPLYSHRIVSLGAPENPAFPDFLQQFLTDYFVYQTYKKVQEKFPNLNWLEKDLNNAFQYFRYYFPQKPVPRFYTFIGGFNQSIVTADSLIGIGLDKYLGAYEEFYLRMDPPFPEYQRRRMRPENINPDCVQAWLVTEFPYVDSTNNLINNIIYEGQIVYGMEKLMPAIHDTLLFNFTAEQLKFCVNNEKTMWTYLIENKLLFNNDKFMIRKFVGEGPFTKDFSQESPGKAVVWLGREIIKSYMSNNKELTLQDLMQESNYQKILNNSGYNP